MVWCVLTNRAVSPLSILKNPMILMAGVAMLMMFGMPKLMENSAPPPQPIPIPIDDARC